MNNKKAPTKLQYICDKCQKKYVRESAYKKHLYECDIVDVDNDSDNNDAQEQQNKLIQLTRLTKMKESENKMCIFDYVNELDMYDVFSVTSSSDPTKTIKVKIVHFKNELFCCCDCPDFAYRCSKTNILCKHCCYILLRLFNYDLNKDVVGRKIINNKLYFEKLKNIHIVKNKNEERNSRKELQKEQNDNNNECPICYIDFAYGENENNDDIIACPKCKHPFHYQCIDVWFKKAGIPSCPYCRHEEWTNFNSKMKTTEDKLVRLGRQ